MINSIIKRNSKKFRLHRFLNFILFITYVGVCVNIKSYVKNLNKLRNTCTMIKNILPKSLI